jgi:hypothetical protein
MDFSKDRRAAAPQQNRKGPQSAGSVAGSEGDDARGANFRNDKERRGDTRTRPGGSGKGGTAAELNPRRGPAYGSSASGRPIPSHPRNAQGKLIYST